MTNAVLTLSFYDADRLCGYGANTSDIVPAGSLVSFTIDRIYLSDEYALVHPCELPAATNRMRVESDSSLWTTTLRAEFDNAYTFLPWWGSILRRNTRTFHAISTNTASGWTS
jgi:hypothetical protein